MSKQTTAPKDRHVSTFWLSHSSLEAGKRPIMHIYGPYTVSQAERIKREFDTEELPEPGLKYAAVCKAWKEESE